MAQNVKFFFTSDLNKYLNLATKDPMALYFIEDATTGYRGLYKGENLIAVGSDATSMASGLMSAEDKIKLDALTVGGVNGLSAVDGTISIVDTVDGGKAIGVAVSAQENNALVAVEDGLFVPRAQEVVIPEYAIEKQETASEGFAATYKLKKTLGEEVSYVGDEINIAKDLVLKSATMQAVAEENTPYDGAVVGDPYIDMEFNDEAETHLYIPMKGLVDQFTAGDGIKIENNVVSINLGANANGLHFVDGTLNLALATSESNGAMSKEDKAFIDSIPTVYATKEYVKKTTEQIRYEIADTPYGTLVNYGEDEIRIMCPTNAEFVKQSVGVGGDANTYYVTFKTYAPNDSAVGYIEHLGDKVDSEILTNFSVDKYGRRYQSTWLGVAKYDETTGNWNYYGTNSSVDKYVGWDYQIDWYDANGLKIAVDAVRINLSNEDCHDSNEPYYMAKYATSEEVNSVKESISNMEDNFTWGEL